MDLKNQRQRRKTALITGACSGIGYELTCIFASQNYNLVLVDINKPRLIEISEKFIQEYGIHVKDIAIDLSISTSPEAIYLELQQASIQIDVLVNNAGFGIYGLFNETNLKSELEMIQVNVVCLTHLTKLFLKHMVEQGNGKILNVSSTAAFQPGPLMSVYFATKSYILSFSEAIANELEDTGVSVTVLCPGPTKSGFHQRTGTENSQRMKDMKMMDAKTVAEIGYRGLMAGQTVVIPGTKNRILAEAVRFLPRKQVTKISKVVQGHGWA
ncbi:MAG: SDR family oxidoreductase [Cyanobacteriota bacterium]|nr:SDR family oxidoreductase [Cyanobacteriota bacterium]